MDKDDLIIVALSGGVDSAVAALILKEKGYKVEALHMTNWEDDGYCESAKDLKDAKQICKHIGVDLHRVNFSDKYKKSVFKDFLKEYEMGRTPNPDILCNRNIKFGVLQEYIKRLGGKYLATGHYAKVLIKQNKSYLLKGKDANKDQSYFLHAVNSYDLENVVFPLGDKYKEEVREIAIKSGLHVAKKKDSTGICFIGERPFAKFLSDYIEKKPGCIKDEDGNVIGEHIGLPYYTIGQRQGLHIGGISMYEEKPWYVAAKDTKNNTIIAVQGSDNPSLFKKKLVTLSSCHWINNCPIELKTAESFRCQAKIRYRQKDQECKIKVLKDHSIEVEFDSLQRAITPGQYIVFYKNEYCLGGAIIDKGIDLEKV
tara:strand:- start:21272 stop:22381 length:1110 start_codon:yes stop_codon:yes gene_type:complete